MINHGEHAIGDPVKNGTRYKRDIFILYENGISGVMISMLPSSVVDHRY